MFLVFGLAIVAYGSQREEALIELNCGQAVLPELGVP
jgi:hypothetical protein